MELRPQPVNVQLFDIDGTTFCVERPGAPKDDHNFGGRGQAPGCATNLPFGIFPGKDSEAGQVGHEADPHKVEADRSGHEADLQKTEAGRGGHEADPKNLRRAEADTTRTRKTEADKRRTRTKLRQMQRRKKADIGSEVNRGVELTHPVRLLKL